MKRHVLLISVIWIGLVSASFAWNYFNAKAEQKNMAFQHFRRQGAFSGRSWWTGNGTLFMAACTFL